MVDRKGKGRLHSTSKNIDLYVNDPIKLDYPIIL